HAFAASRTIDGELGDVVHGENVISVGLLARYAVADRLVDELFRRRLFARRRRVRVAVVLDDDDERTLLNSGEVDAFVERAGGRRAVADEHEADATFAAHLEAHRYTGHHRHHVAKRRDLADEAAVGVAEVDVQLASARRRIALRHVLL